MSNRRGKRFTFPENVDSSYDVFMGLTLKEVTFYVVPSFLIGIIFVALPPHSFIVTLFKIVIVLMAVVIVIALLSSRPVKSRPNIRFGAFMKQKQEFSKRQKVYYLAPKKRKFGENEVSK